MGSSLLDFFLNVFLVISRVRLLYIWLGLWPPPPLLLLRLDSCISYKKPIPTKPRTKYFNQSYFQNRDQKMIWTNIFYVFRSLQGVKKYDTFRLIPYIQELVPYRIPIPTTLRETVNSSPNIANKLSKEVCVNIDINKFSKTKSSSVIFYS